MFRLRNLFESASEKHASHNPPATERRQACRYEPIDRRTTLGWWDGPDFHATPASLNNISLGGASVMVVDSPPIGPIWFHVESEENRTDDWIEAELIQSDASVTGSTVVHIRFPGGCPYNWFRSAVYGQSGESAPEGVSREFDGRYWK